MRKVLPGENREIRTDIERTKYSTEPPTEHDVRSGKSLATTRYANLRPSISEISSQKMLTLLTFRTCEDSLQICATFRKSLPGTLEIA